ncbi:hypothetical protein DFS34DRAFT_630964 [Phlyctochytrium arcticum]|nr:hypothetical protein DFS34DRAFT_630964 [Phlyctochytrium arcticum]
MFELFVPSLLQNGRRTFFFWLTCRGFIVDCFILCLAFQGFFCQSPTFLCPTTLNIMSVPAAARNAPFPHAMVFVRGKITLLNNWYLNVTYTFKGADGSLQRSVIVRRAPVWGELQDFVSCGQIVDVFGTLHSLNVICATHFFTATGKQILP